MLFIAKYLNFSYFENAVFMHVTEIMTGQSSPSERTCETIELCYCTKLHCVEIDFNLCTDNRTAGPYYVRSSPEDLANPSCPIRLEGLASLVYPNHLEDLASLVYPSHLEDLSSHVCPLQDLELVSRCPVPY